jgi:Ca-activated chloride channel family protein
MRCITRLSLAAGLACVFAPLLLAAQEQQPTFKSGTKVVPLYVTVSDANRRLVAGLAKEDFEIYDNGKLQPTVIFTNEVQPITVVVMLDTSGSMTGNIDLVKAAAEQFFIRLLPEDRARLGAFNDKIQLVSEMTGDRDELVAALRAVDFGYPTRLYDAVATGLDELKGVEGRKVVLVFTDGDDTSSKVRFGTILDRARDEEVMVYAIGLENDYFNGVARVRSRPDRSLKRLAEETGGGYFELKSTAELNSTFTRVSEELHSQYVIGFSPAVLDGKLHKLEVRVKQPGLTARTRKSYVAQ